MSEQLELDFGDDENGNAQIKVVVSPHVRTGSPMLIGPGSYARPVADFFRKAFDVSPRGHELSKPGQKWIEDIAQRDQTTEPILSTDSAERKNTPIYSGLLMYFPLACAAVARHSKRGNDKHNSGEPLHWAREKSDDHLDCIVRHAIDANHFNAEIGEYEEACALAWRALANLQLLEEKRLGRSPK